MTKLAGKIIDGGTGEAVEARVQVVGPGGNQLAPADAMFKVGSGEPFFYSDGEFSLEVPRGRVEITVERGTEFTPWGQTCRSGAGIPETRISSTTRRRATRTAGSPTTRGWKIYG